MANTYDYVTANVSDILSALDNLQAAMDNVLLHLGTKMTPADFIARGQLVERAQTILKEAEWNEEHG